ncbi:MAG TPA: hypothetical protein VIG66_00410 [Noviherbaspirillum sp.]
MSNLGSAKSAIKAELAHAREGAAYYQSLVTALEEALNRLDSVGPEGGRAPKHAAALSDKPVRGRRGRKPRVEAAAESEGELPGTRKEFWVDLVDSQPKSAVDVVQAAVDKLGFKPSRDQIKKLSQRATYALNTMVKSGEISDSGNGRARRFFRAG